jgi:serine phosphatase RsbU (regulator of sigma subunit)
MPDTRYTSEECVLASPSRLFVFSDGTFEVTRPDGSMLEDHAFREVLAQPLGANESELDRLLDFAREVHGERTLEDDFSIVKLEV